MRRFRRFSLLRWISLALIVAAVLLLVFQLIVFSRLRSSFSPGSKIAGVDVSGLSVPEAADRLTQVYSVPVELNYGESSFQAKPATLGFSLDLSGMMAVADQSRVSLPFWSAFWDYLFNSLPASNDIPLHSKIDVNVMRTFLETEIASRYDLAPEPVVPIPGNIYFQTGKPGTKMDIERSIDLISMALKSPVSRIVNLSISQTTSARPSIENLKVLLAQIIDVDGFTGITEIYMVDLQNGQDFQLAYQSGEQYQPDIAFSALSTIKIPIMIEVYRRSSEPINPTIFSLLENMIVRSDNPSADKLMQDLIDPNYGPREVTHTMKALGLKNTYLAGMFYNGAPLIDIIKTPANSRTDVFTNSDIYSQTTATEMGLLLEDIYQCAQNGGGSLFAAFPGQITQNECRAMITLLSRNRDGALIEAGLPDGTQMGHKHGWASDPVDGLIHFIGDTALIYSPGGNFVLSIFITDTNQIVWDSANKLYADLSRAVYNYFNLNAQ
ncbi:MAG: serine hydrolase [Chloroflexi bacterium]|nr:serine hydrolase [Chloroflexota bacterium]